MYIPILKSTGSKFQASLVVFFTSAFFHEYLVSVPLRTFKVRYGGS
jgi:diacylglycerol O-acyltransferase-1